MTKRKESTEYTLYGDLNGMTVAQLREILSEFPDDAQIDVRSEKVYGYGGWTDQDREFFVFVWEE
jgi:hypothetical protein